MCNYIKIIHNSRYIQSTVAQNDNSEFKMESKSITPEASTVWMFCNHSRLSAIVVLHSRIVHFIIAVYRWRCSIFTLKSLALPLHRGQFQILTIDGAVLDI